MAMGPLETFVFPGVYVKTINEAAEASAAGQLRFPGFIGVSAEELRVSDFEMVRGSSAVADNLILDEDVSSQFTGTENTFQVQNYPIVTGSGNGAVATLPSNVVVTINGEPVAVNAVNGLLGEVTMVAIPSATDEVRANYYFKRRDTYVENEDLSVQADGSNKIFKVNNARIVKGDNSGRAATDSDINSVVTILYNPDPNVPGDEFERSVRVIQVKVNGSESTIAELDGSVGTFQLETAPGSGDEVTINYFSNLWQDTYDILPAAVVSRLVKVGLSQDTSDFSIGQDCVLAGYNKLHWGASYNTQLGIFTAGSDPLESNLSVSVTDTRVYGLVSAPLNPATDGLGNPLVDANGDEINLDGNKIFTLPTTPVSGDGTGKATEDPSDVIAYIGQSWSAAKTAGAVTVTKIVGNDIYLNVSPSQALEEKVYTTYYESNIVDDTWTLTNEVPGGANVGKYTIFSRLHGNGLDVVQSGGTVSAVYAGAGALNTAVNPLRASVERVTVTFDGVGVYTVTSKVGPAFTTNGQTGSDTASNTGYTGQTYIDSVTGFRVSFSDNIGLFNPGVGDTLVYDIGDPTKSDATEQRYITAKTDIVRVIPGVNLTVSSTDGGTIDNTDDTVLISTFNKSGNEPSNGDIYYVTFDREKTNYNIRFFTNMRDVMKYYGPIDINNQLTVAANLAFQNGARAVALKQIRKAPGSGDATVQDYIDGIDAFNEPLPSGLRPSMIQPLSSDPQVHSYLKSSNAIQSSVRYKNERTSIIGFSYGTTPDQVINRVRNLKTEKLTAIYPDAAIIGIEDAYGNEVEYLVEGPMIAAAVAGRDVSPATDIATPMTNATIVGFKRLQNRLDNVTAAQVAQAGCTVLEEQNPVIRILMYLTTDVSTSLTRDPRIIEVKHFIQQGVRGVLNRYIGVKNLPKVTPQVRDTLGSYFRSLKQQELIVNFTGINVTQNQQDPSTLDVEAYYSPVFPVNWIVVTLNLRTSV